MRKPIDIGGVRFGRLVAIRDSGERHNTEAVWECACDCGGAALVPGSRLRNGHTKSCGCYRKARLGDATRTHGLSKSPEYVMFYDARKRARQFGVPLRIKPTDITIPNQCPVLGIPLVAGGERDSAPSLDRLIPSNGYVPGNVRVISFRANRIKSDATASELRSIIAYMEGSCAT
jgi:hypothetical protein